MQPKTGDKRGEFCLTVCVGLGEYGFDLSARGLAADAECKCRRIDTIARRKASGQPGLGCCQAKCSAQAQCIRARQRPQVGQQEDGASGGEQITPSALSGITSARSQGLSPRQMSTGAEQALRSAARGFSRN